MSIYMRIPGIKGNVEAKKYAGWIDIDDLEFGGVHNKTSMITGTEMNCFGTVPCFSQVTLLKPMDSSSPYLFQASCPISIFPEVEFHYVYTDAELTAYAKTLLSEVAITHYGERFRSGTGSPWECISLSYTKIERTYIPRNTQNKTTTPITAGYNIETAQRL